MPRVKSSATESKASRKAAAADTKKRTKRTKKDPNAPKRALSAYMMYSQANRDRVRKENPDATFGEIGKFLGAEWSKLSDDGKAPYIKKAEADKERYATEKAEYDAKKDSDESD
ncbi:hypothetical protein DL89DRAFT_267350 [Linderina pennispora]|uniref:HMG box domain-containing protein n=1 Tax=Linderina pennispora TaxID=61395 RepID=A0A1Y1W9E2_9FUNG|nr:uncharacterized protein DL89DRAFT_267350 [Linderina pennispora]ORX70133.1 hypothetical protein DL89DRAFT_267350 [Linderina pennispora]